MCSFRWIKASIWLRWVGLSWFDYLVIMPFLQSSPGEIIGLRIIVPEYKIFSVNHLLDLSQCNTITLRAERHNSLRQPAQQQKHKQTPHRTSNIIILWKCHINPHSSSRLFHIVKVIYGYLDFGKVFPEPKHEQYYSWKYGQFLPKRPEMMLNSWPHKFHQLYHHPCMWNPWASVSCLFVQAVPWFYWTPRQRSKRHRMQVVPLDSQLDSVYDVYHVHDELIQHLIVCCGKQHFAIYFNLKFGNGSNLIIMKCITRYFGLDSLV